MEENQVYETWDIKKILTALILFVLLGVSAKILIFDKKASSAPNNLQNVQGVSTQATSSPAAVVDLKTNFQTSLDNLKKDVNNINVVDVATSTPAVQKIITEIKSLQDLPQSQAKRACFQICNGL